MQTAGNDTKFLEMPKLVQECSRSRGGSYLGLLTQSLIEPDNSLDTGTQRQPNALVLAPHHHAAVALEPLAKAAVLDHLAAVLYEVRETIAPERPAQAADGRHDRGRDVRLGHVAREDQRAVERGTRGGRRTGAEGVCDDVAGVGPLEAHGALVLPHHLGVRKSHQGEGRCGKGTGEQIGGGGHETGTHERRCEIEAISPAPLDAHPANDSPVDEIGKSGPQGEAGCTGAK